MSDNPIKMWDWEDVTRPRWRCPATGEIEYCQARDRSAEPARKRLMKRVKPGSEIEYRAGFLPRGSIS